MTDALGQIALVDVVRPDAHHQELMIELFDDLGVVIHPF